MTFRRLKVYRGEEKKYESLSQRMRNYGYTIYVPYRFYVVMARKKKCYIFSVDVHTNSIRTSSELNSNI